MQDAQGGEPGAVALREEQRLPVHYHQLHMLRAAPVRTRVLRFMLSSQIHLL